MKIISRLFHPVIIFPLTLFLMFNHEQRYFDFAVIFGLTFMIPFTYTFWLYLNKKITDLDVSKREQRFPIYMLTLLCMILSGVYLYFFSSADLFKEFLGMFLLALTLVLMNYKTKVSIHTALTTLLTLILILEYEISPWIFLLVPLVAVSRLQLKRHRLEEVILGATTPFLFYIFLV